MIIDVSRCCNVGFVKRSVHVLAHVGSLLFCEPVYPSRTGANVCARMPLCVCQTVFTQCDLKFCFHCFLFRIKMSWTNVVCVLIPVSQ